MLLGVIKKQPGNKWAYLGINGQYLVNGKNRMGVFQFFIKQVSQLLDAHLCYLV